MKSATFAASSQGNLELSELYDHIITVNHRFPPKLIINLGDQMPQCLDPSRLGRSLLQFSAGGHAEPLHVRPSCHWIPGSLLVQEYGGSKNIYAGWWFGTWMDYDFPYTGNSHPNWLIFFRGIETTNQCEFMNMIFLSSPALSLPNLWPSEVLNQPIWVHPMPKLLRYLGRCQLGECHLPLMDAWWWRRMPKSLSAIWYCSNHQ